uniref:DALR anticodon binding domain-containing protein n=1 Tax=Strigamia maritima TaxID=126957 RepID=T1IZ72_STRMM
MKCHLRPKVGVPTIDKNQFCYEVNNEKDNSTTECHVGKVNTIHSKTSSTEELEECCTNLIIKSAVHKFKQLTADGEKEVDKIHASTLDACIKFNLLYASPKRSIVLDLNENNLNLIKSGSFVMYNYARLASIIHKFDDLVQSHQYPPMAEINEVQFSLLRREEEWLLIRDYLMYFPYVVNEVICEIGGHPPVHKFQHFLLSLSHRISTYYSKVRILMDPSNHLIPLIFARISLLKAVLQIMTNCFLIMDIIPITKM